MGAILGAHLAVVQGVRLWCLQLRTPAHRLPALACWHHPTDAPPGLSPHTHRPEPRHKAGERQSPGVIAVANLRPLLRALSSPEPA